MKNFRIDTKGKLDNFLKLIVEKSAREAAEALAEDERDRQEDMSQGLKGLRASNSQQEVEEAEEEESSGEDDDGEEEEESEEEEETVYFKGGSKDHK